MADGPTLTKLIVLLIIMTVIYALFISPLMTAAYYAVTKGRYENMDGLSE